MSAREDSRQGPVKLYVSLGWLFDDISGSMYSFGLASFVDLENIILLQWVAAGSSRKSIGERLGWNKVSHISSKLTDFMLRGR